MCASAFFWGHIPMDLWTTGANSAKALLFQLRCVHGRGFTKAMLPSGAMHCSHLGVAGLHQWEYAMWIRLGECLLNSKWRQRRKNINIYIIRHKSFTDYLHGMRSASLILCSPFHNQCFLPPGYGWDMATSSIVFALCSSCLFSWIFLEWGKKKQAKVRLKKGGKKSRRPMLMVILELSRDITEALIKFTIFSNFLAALIDLLCVTSGLNLLHCIYTTVLFLSLMCCILVMSSCGLQFFSNTVQNIHATTWNQVFQYESKSLQDLHKPLG